MPSLTITIDIAAAPVAGHALNKLGKFGADEAAILDRIGRANQSAFPNHKYRPEAIVLQAIAAAVAAAEI